MDPNERLHRDWLGMAQPEGLVVSLAALKAAEANITWPVTELQAQLAELVVHGHLADRGALFRDLLGWSDEFVVEYGALPPELSAVIEGGERLSPTRALRSADVEGAFVLLISEVDGSVGLDVAQDEQRWTASPHQRFERLLRETGVPAGLLTNGRDFRLVYAPRGESAGWVTFRLAEMLSVDGRPLLGAFHMLLNERRLLTLAEERRLLGLLQASRAYQSTVSTALREQVLGALRTLLQGFQAADRLAEGKVLGSYRGEAMREVYLGLVTVLMRMVFILFAEERDLLPMSNGLYAESYSLTRLHAQLVKDRGEHGEGLATRYGAWARVLTLFRVLHDGLKTPNNLRLPPREGKLFNPDEFPFLEGRPRGSARQKGEKLRVPRVSDNVVFLVLDQLLMLAGERLQYKGLDVEQIGSVYEGLMGFEIQMAEGDSLCLSPEHVVVNLEPLLKLAGPERLKALKAEANLDLKEKIAAEVKAARSIQELQTALGRRVSPRHPGLIERGSLFLQPGEERRRSGSHYTPRSLTQPIVETTLRPVLERLRTSPPGPLSLEGRGGGETSPPGPLPIDGEGGEGGGGVTGRAVVSDEMLRRAREMRRLPTAAEAAAWEILRDRRCLGLKFRRQQVIDGFITDFYCAEHRLVVEIDGPIHDEQREYDEIRTRMLEARNIRVLRVRNEDVSPPTLQSLLEPLLSSAPLSSAPLPIDGEGPGVRSLLPLGERGPGGEVSPADILSLKICDPAMGSGAFLVEVCRQLADHLVAAWRRTGTMPELPPDEDPLLHARRLVAQKCIYGVDKNPLAVDLARLSMWLVTFAKDHPFTFVDHSLRCGDSLVGLSKEQIIDLTPYPLTPKGDEQEKKPAKGKKGAEKAAGVQLDLVRPLVAEAVSRADGLRKQIHAIGDPPDNAELRRLWMDTNEALAHVRLLGDLVVAAYFGQDSDKGRKAALENLRIKVQTWLSTGALEAELRGMAAGLREGTRPLEPFHWEIEFPEVFARENGGFDCFVGNPPFLGGTMISTAYGMAYLSWLSQRYEDSGNRADLVVYFFRQSFELCREHGTAGLIATNTISQGDTRDAGLAWICTHGGRIYDATRRLRWPGVAAVTVSVVHLLRDKGRKVAVSSILDGSSVSRISAFLFPGYADLSPNQLVCNADTCYEGYKLAGQGFLFADNDAEATTIAEMRILENRNPRIVERIRPYLGGDEINTDPCQYHERHVIDFGSMSEEEAWAWPDLMAIVQAKVKPLRDKANRDAHRLRWWQYGEVRPGLRASIANKKRMLTCSLVSKHPSFAWLPTDRIVSHNVGVFCVEQESFFSVVQSRIHYLFSSFFSSSLEDRQGYRPSDCFDPFPFPPALYPLNSPPPSPALDALEAIGKEYYEFRAALMADEAVRAKLMDGLPPEGLTKTYNKFHDPDCHLPGIVRLRELHAKMDRAVLDAYGWQDIRPEYDFREQLDESIRLTWSEETRDEVLARLLELNRVMAEAEAAEASKGQEAKKAQEATRKAEQKAAGAEGKKPRGGRKKGEPEGQGGLFG